MSEEKQIYTKEELEDMSRVDLRKLAVKTWGMDNKECSGTKSQALREYILEKQAAYEGGEDEAPKSKGKSGGKAAPSAGGRRPSAGKVTPKPGAGKRPSPKEEPPEEPEEPEEPQDEPQDEPEPEPRGRRGRAASGGGGGGGGDISGRIDAIGKTLDQNQEETKETLQEIKDTLENIRLSQYILHGLIADIYRLSYEPEDLDSRVDELEKEFNEPEEGNE